MAYLLKYNLRRLGFLLACPILIHTEIPVSSPSTSCAIPTLHTFSLRHPLFAFVFQCLHLCPVFLLKKPLSDKILLCFHVYINGVSFFHITRLNSSHRPCISTALPLRFMAYYSTPYIKIISGNVCSPMRL